MNGARFAFRVLEGAVRELVADTSRRDVRVSAVALEGAAMDVALRLIWLAVAGGRLEAIAAIVDYGMVDPPAGLDG